MPDPDPTPTPPLPDPPRTPKMPELLTRPVDHPRAGEVLGGGGTGGGSMGGTGGGMGGGGVNGGGSDAAAMARGWAIAFNFGATVAAAGLIGWAVQKWLWPASAPWMLLIFLGLGLVSGFVQFVRAGLEANR